MSKRRIHGDWTMVFEGRILKSKIIGATNSEAGIAWLEELKVNIIQSPEGVDTPWVGFLDFRDWQGTSLDSLEQYQVATSWATQNNAIMCAYVISKELQGYSIKKLNSNMLDDSFNRYFFSYDEAYQACLDKLSEVQKQ
ncbi:hypothetical protein L4C34_11910 [Vibrio profundum]|uniref:hypothetical protein n=1 Tax=Vibrio profundum TaxID=2910247 RepID=UPI003D12EF58